MDGQGGQGWTPEGGNTSPPRAPALEKRRRYTNVTFTSFQVDREITLHNSMSYLIWQLEKTKDGRLHYQGYCQLKVDKHGNGPSFAQLKKIFTEIGHYAAHLEGSMGSLEDNVRYCSKVESRVDGPWELGTPRAAGRKRINLAAAREEVEITLAAAESIRHDAEMTLYRREWLCPKCVKYWRMNHGTDTARPYCEGDVCYDE